MKMQGVAVAWLRESDWPAWLAMDANFQPDYRSWLERMEAVYARVKATGVPVVKVTIRPAEFLEWTGANGRGVGTQARAAFASVKAMTLDYGKDMH